MKVLQVHVRYRQPGGEDAVVAQEGALLRAGGHEVRSLDLRNPLAFRSASVALLRASWNSGAAEEVAEAAISWGADIAHVHNTWYALSAAVLPALRERGVATVMTLHNYRTSCLNAVLLRDGLPCYDCVGKVPWRGVVHRCYRESVTQSVAAGVALEVARRRRTWVDDVDAFIVLSEHAQRFFIRSGMPRSKLHIAPNVLDGASMRATSPSRSKTLLYVGRLSREKGVVELLEAWRAAAPLDVELDIVGDGPLRRSLAERLPNGVRLLGQQPPDIVRQLMSGARALVVPSLWDEMFPRTMVEALASGTPVLASRRAGPRDMLVAAGCDSWLVESGSGPAWTEALQRLENGDLADDLDRASSAVRFYYENHLTPVHGLQRLEAVYDAALKRHG